MSPATGDDINLKALLARTKDALIQIQGYKVREKTLRLFSRATERPYLCFQPPPSMLLAVL